MSTAVDVVEQRSTQARPARPDAALRTVLWLAAAAVALRLLVFTSRGDYVAFDEGWYLLLGRSVFAGEGYMLTGLRHTTLSPLFPLLAGAAGTLTGPVWGGRIVAAVAAGLLVIPCWSIFRRIAGDRAALIACIFVAVIPSLTAFAAPYWIGWDLWVGAEPLLHLFLYSGIALVLRARERHTWIPWIGAGVMFALAYLARPEAILPFGVLGVTVGVLALRQLRLRPVAQALTCALAFAVTAAPYWLYLHDVLGRWTISGRAVEQPTLRSSAGPRPPAGGNAAATIERMLWDDDERAYVKTLYGLDASATSLSSTYWGFPRRDPGPAHAQPDAAAPPASAPPPAAPEPAAATADDTRPDPGARQQSRWQRYIAALGVIAPWYLWLFVPLGGFAIRAAWRDELLVVLPLLLTSIAISRLVAADPRTQLFMVPLVALYAAIGAARVGDGVERRIRAASVRQGFLARVLVVILAALLLATEARWIYLGITLGSPHHLVGAANRKAGAALRDIVPPDDPVMSWHPALALYAGRDWRVLPGAPFPDIVRYANATTSEYVVLSVYYPSPLTAEQMPREYLAVHVPAGAAGLNGSWQLAVTGMTDVLAVGRLTPPPR